MWLATRHGFYSIVCAGRPGNVEKNRMYIRARRVSHLKNLQAFHKALGPIMETKYRNYPYRLAAKRSAVMKVIARLAADIDYDNFKAATQAAMPKDSAYTHFLHSMWEAGARMTIRGTCLYQHTP